MWSRSLFAHAALLLLLLPPQVQLWSGLVSAEYSSKSEPDYEFGDYRGKWCLDDHGFVFSIGEVYYPSRVACPCTCTVDGPVCVRPRCPRIHPRCTRISYKACCPVCETLTRVCVYGGKTYRLLEEFRVRRLELLRLCLFHVPPFVSSMSLHFVSSMSLHLSLSCPSIRALLSFTHHKCPLLPQNQVVCYTFIYRSKLQ